MFNNKNILITGGTGSFGKSLTEILKIKVKRLVIIRDEAKQFQMSQEFNKKTTTFL